MAQSTKKNKKQSPEAAMRARYQAKYGTPKFGYRKCRECGKVDVEDAFKGRVCKAKFLKALQHGYYVKRQASSSQKKVKA